MPSKNKINPTGGLLKKLNSYGDKRIREIKHLIFVRYSPLEGVYNTLNIRTQKLSMSESNTRMGDLLGSAHILSRSWDIFLSFSLSPL